MELVNAPRNGAVADIDGQDSLSRQSAVRGTGQAIRSGSAGAVSSQRAGDARRGFDSPHDWLLADLTTPAMLDFEDGSGDIGVFWAVRDEIEALGASPVVLQFTDRALVAGNTLDANAFRGTRAEFADLLGVPEPPVPPSPTAAPSPAPEARTQAEPTRGVLPGLGHQTTR